MYGVGSVVIDKSDNLMIQYRRRPICSVAGGETEGTNGGGRFVVYPSPLDHPQTRGSAAVVIGRFAPPGGGNIIENPTVIVSSNFG